LQPQIAPQQKGGHAVRQRPGHQVNGQSSGVGIIALVAQARPDRQPVLAGTQSGFKLVLEAVLGGGLQAGQGKALPRQSFDLDRQLAARQGDRAAIADGQLDPRARFHT